MTENKESFVQKCRKVNFYLFKYDNSAIIRNINKIQREES